MAAADLTKAIMDAPFPTEKRRMWSCLSTCNVYRRFVHGFVGVARPLNEMLRMNVEVYWEGTTNNERDAFETLKKSLVNPQLLVLPKR